MINQLRQFYNDDDELVIPYDPEQKELYMEATKELEEAAKYLIHHSPELRKSRDKIERKYRKKGLLLDLFGLPKGIHSNEGNFFAMVLKRFLKDKGFHVLVSEEDYFLMWQRGHHNTNDGFKIIENIFGTEKIKELLLRAPSGGDPDVFAFLDHNPKLAWFIEAKRQGEPFTKKQGMNFPYINELLRRKVEIARIVPSQQKNQEKNPMTKKQYSVSLINENNLIALKNQSDKAVHIVFPDRSSGELRICRPSMLKTTHGSSPTEWEVVGSVRDARHYVEEVVEIGCRYCGECLRHLPAQTSKK
ncbi:MAG: hypothetical protein C4518_16120 [Desulfobacteraceae bacterium]|nr:MAG: hypothetical protein C4518_16120 [Desulfobacteraceae bacterium]